MIPIRWFEWLSTSKDSIIALRENIFDADIVKDSLGAMGSALHDYLSIRNPDTSDDASLSIGNLRKGVHVPIPEDGYTGYTLMVRIPGEDRERSLWLDIPRVKVLRDIMRKYYAITNGMKDLTMESYFWDDEGSLWRGKGTMRIDTELLGNGFDGPLLELSEDKQAHILRLTYGDSSLKNNTSLLRRHMDWIAENFDKCTDGWDRYNPIDSKDKRRNDANTTDNESGNDILRRIKLNLPQLSLITDENRDDTNTLSSDTDNTSTEPNIDNIRYEPRVISFSSYYDEQFNNLCLTPSATSPDEIDESEWIRYASD